MDKNTNNRYKLKNSSKCQKHKQTVCRKESMEKLKKTKSRCDSRTTKENLKSLISSNRDNTATQKSNESLKPKKKVFKATRNHIALNIHRVRHFERKPHSFKDKSKQKSVARDVEKNDNKNFGDQRVSEIKKKLSRFRSNTKTKVQFLSCPSNTKECSKGNSNNLMHSPESFVCTEMHYDLRDEGIYKAALSWKKASQITDTELKPSDEILKELSCDDLKRGEKHADWKSNDPSVTVSDKICKTNGQEYYIASQVAEQIVRNESEFMLLSSRSYELTRTSSQSSNYKHAPDTWNTLELDCSKSELSTSSLPDSILDSLEELVKNNSVVPKDQKECIKTEKDTAHQEDQLLEDENIKNSVQNLKYDTFEPTAKRQKVLELACSLKSVNSRTDLHSDNRTQYFEMFDEKEKQCENEITKLKNIWCNPDKELAIYKVEAYNSINAGEVESHIDKMKDGLSDTRDDINNLHVLKEIDSNKMTREDICEELQVNVKTLIEHDITEYQNCSIGKKSIALKVLEHIRIFESEDNQEYNTAEKNIKRSKETPEIEFNSNEDLTNDCEIKSCYEELSTTIDDKQDEDTSKIQVFNNTNQEDILNCDFKGQAKDNNTETLNTDEACDEKNQNNKMLKNDTCDTKYIETKKIPYYDEKENEPDISVDGIHYSHNGHKKTQNLVSEDVFKGEIVTNDNQKDYIPGITEEQNEIKEGILNVLKQNYPINSLHVSNNKETKDTETYVDDTNEQHEENAKKLRDISDISYDISEQITEISCKEKNNGHDFNLIQSNTSLRKEKSTEKYTEDECSIEDALIHVLEDLFNTKNIEHDKNVSENSEEVELCVTKGTFNATHLCVNNVIENSKHQTDASSILNPETEPLDSNDINETKNDMDLKESDMVESQEDNISTDEDDDVSDIDYCTLLSELNICRSQSISDIGLVILAMIVVGFSLVLILFTTGYVARDQ